MLAKWDSVRDFAAGPGGGLGGHDRFYHATGTSLTNIASGFTHTLGITSDGHVACWGNNSHEYGYASVPLGLSNVMAVGGGQYHSVALKSDGTVVAWGANNDSQTNVPSGLSNVVAISVGPFDCLALKGDGTVISWGFAFYSTPPAGLSNVVAHSLALKSDGTVAFWGATYVPPGVSNLVGIAAGGDIYSDNYGLNLGIKSDGCGLGPSPFRVNGNLNRPHCWTPSRFRPG